MPGWAGVGKGSLMSGRSLIVALFFAVFIVGGHLYLNNPLASGILVEGDDYMRFVQVFQFLDGGGWYNFVIHRLNPPDGTPLHWSRLPDLPLALIVGGLEGSVGRLQAAAIAATIVPTLLMVAMLVAVSWAAKPVIGKDQPFVPMVVFAIMVSVNSLFAPGRVDHHNWQLLLLTILTGGLMRAALDARRAPRLMAVCGAAAATSLWIGGEALPWIGLFVASLSLLWVFRRARSLANGLTFSLTFLAGGLVVMPLALPPSAWFTVACDAYSLAGLGLILACVVFWGCLAAVDRHLASIGGRLVVAGVIGLLCLAGVAMAFPQCLEGPYGTLDPRLSYWLRNIQETLPIYRIFALSPGSALRHLLLPLTGLAIAVWQIRANTGDRRAMWSVLALWGAVPIALSCWEVRVMNSAHVMALPALAWGYGQIVDLADRKRSVLARVLLKVSPLLLILFVDRLLVLGNLVQQVTLATAESGPKGCDLRQVVDTLNDPNGLGRHPHNIASFIDQGSELLYRTSHSVLAAPYHRDQVGLLASHDIFSAPTDAAARSLIDQYKVDLVIYCPEIPEWSFYSDPTAPTFIDRLDRGQGPDWLRPVTLQSATGIKIFEVVRQGS